MLRVNVGLSRKISRDYQSTGYSINVDGEIGTHPDDPKTTLEAIHRLYRLAEDALAREIDRDQGEDAQGRRDEPPKQDNGPPSDREPTSRTTSPGNQPTNGPRNGQEEAATNKQVTYLLSLGKRQGLSKAQLEGRIEEMLGQRVTVYQLTKREAGRLIDTLTQTPPATGRR